MQDFKYTNGGTLCQSFSFLAKICFMLKCFKDYWGKGQLQFKWVSNDNVSKTHGLLIINMIFRHSRPEGESSINPTRLSRYDQFGLFFSQFITKGNKTLLWNGFANQLVFLLVHRSIGQIHIKRKFDIEDRVFPARPIFFDHLYIFQYFAFLFRVCEKKRRQAKWLFDCSVVLWALWYNF